MSETAVALAHVEYCLEHGLAQRARDWARRAAETMPKDLVLPAHITVGESADRARVNCGRCGVARWVTSLAQAADFRDAHVHCGEDRVRLWRCAECHALEYVGLRCRCCDGVQALGIEIREPGDVVAQRWRWDLVVAGVTVGSVECGSRRKTEAAARIMFPGDAAVVRRVR